MLTTFSLILKIFDQALNVSVYVTIIFVLFLLCFYKLYGATRVLI